MSDEIQLLFTHRLILQDLKRHGPSTADEICKRHNLSLIWTQLHSLGNHGYIKAIPLGENVKYELTKKSKGLWFLKGITEVQK